MKTFYVVWREGDRNPMVKHPSKQEAMIEAERIAAKEMTPVHVLGLVSTCTATVKIEWEHPADARSNAEILGRCPYCDNYTCTCEKGAV